MLILLKRLFFVVVITITSVSHTAQEQIDLTVNGLHNGNLRIVEDNSALFSGDSFQLEIKVNSAQHIYSFLLNSSNELTVLNSGYKLNNTSFKLPADDHWYKLDDKVGVETLIVVGSITPLDINSLSYNIKKNKWDSKMFDGTIVKRSIIKHIDKKTFIRGMQIVTKKGASASNVDFNALHTGVTNKLPKNEVPVSGIINKLVSFSNTPIKTRGIKEVHVFKKAAPAVVKVFTKTGSGSGSLISKDGLILTNWHVVKNSKKTGIVFMPKNRNKITKDDFLFGNVIKINGEADLALIRLQSTPENAHPLSISNKKPEIGQDVHAIGHPKGGADWTYTKGYISQLNYDDRWSYKDTTHKVALMIQSQTPLNPGNSGGPLLNNDGKIVGVNSSSSLDYASANYAISAEDVRAFLKQKGDVKVKKKKISKKKRKSKNKDKAIKNKDKLEKLSEELGVNVVSVEIVDYTKEGSKDFKISIDDDKNGAVEMTVIILEDKKKARIIIYDDNEDGSWDEMALDEDNNGKVDTHLYSNEDGDGIGVIGYDDDEDGTVDRYEDFK